jgi:hypothetical protein
LAIVMERQRQTAFVRNAARTARAGSWMALLAAATLGEGVSTVRAEVLADGLADAQSYRLVVQSYAGQPGARSKPLGSKQRVVTGAELRRGVRIDLVEMHGAGPSSAGDSPVVVAWVEDGQGALEFDGRQARPGLDSVSGSAARGGVEDRVSIRLVPPRDV